MKFVGVLGLAMSLAACGLADVGTSAATAGKVAAEQAKQGQAAADKIKQDLEAANKAQAARLDDAEKK